MNRSESRQPDPPHIAAQVAASWASLDAAIRAGNLDIALNAQDRAFLGTIREMQVPLDFGGTPEHILGSTATKHGEIAEQVHVAVNRARDVLFGHAPTATFEGVGRSAPIYYLSDGVGVQSKYYNGLYNMREPVGVYSVAPASTRIWMISRLPAAIASSSMDLPSPSLALTSAPASTRSLTNSKLLSWNIA